MNSGITVDLLAASAWTLLACVISLSRTFPVRYAVVLSTIKVALPAVYFGFFFNYGWTSYDDMTYFEVGRDLTLSEWNPFSIWMSEEGRTQLFALGGGSHIVYYWWNFLAQWSFGEEYWAPIMLNVVAVVISASFLERLVRVAGFSRPYARTLTGFYLLHPEVLAWSSFVNLKDTLVLTLCITAFWGIAELLERGLRFAAVLAVSLSFICLLFLRFYAPLLIAAAVGLWMVVGARLTPRKAVIGASVVAAGAFAIGYEAIRESVGLLDFNNIAFGFVRMALTPTPWSLSSEYSFLFLPAILHWALFIPAVVGAGALLKRSRIGALAVICLLLSLLLYGAFDELQGPRHRLQVTWIVVWAQFHGIQLLLMSALRNVRNPVHA